MKIKAVCELTGLSDRTIRYYIEEGLILPSYTENYLGRRSYSFSEKEIKELNDIAVLRKFDFTIEEIRTIIKNFEASKSILLDVRSRTAANVLNNQEKLATLSQINTERSYTVSQLAEELSKISLALPTHTEVVSFSVAKKVCSIIKAIVISAIVWLPILLSLFIVIISISDYHYPVFNPVMIASTVAAILPSITVLLTAKVKFSFAKSLKRILLIFCVLSIPISFILSFGIVSKSETTDFHNYRDFDANCLANRNIVFQELFPNWPHYFENIKQADGSYETAYLDAKYYYHYYEGFDYTYDIYAEWPLDENEYYEEINRVNDLFKNAVANKTYNYKFTEIKKGNYRCLILYSGNEPFSPVTDSYDYIIFANNEKAKTVRYIYCDSLENGADQPYYLSLDW